MVPPLFIFSLQKKPHTVVAVQMKTKSPLIRRSKDVNHVVPPFYRLLTEKPALSGHLATTAAVTGSRIFLLYASENRLQDVFHG